MRGPALDLERLRAAFPFLRCDTGFRITCFYDVAIDETATRLDVKIGANQYGVVFRSTSPQPPQPGKCILPTDDLVTPKKGVVDCLNIKAAKADLIAGLEELLADLKADVQPEKSADAA